MTSILRGLYNGEIVPWERPNPNNEKQRECLQKIEKEERYFIEKMSLEDCQRFQQLGQLYTEVSVQDEENVFSYGFTLGMILMLEVAEEAKRMIG